MIVLDAAGNAAYVMVGERVSLASPMPLNPRR